VASFGGINYAHTLEAVGPLEPGDVIITNDPYGSAAAATHLPDIHLIRPIFRDGRLVAHAAGFLHSSDVGGMVPASISPRASEIFQEGLRVPPKKLFVRGAVNRDLLDVILANCRIPEQNWGDLQALVAGLVTGERRVHALIARFGSMVNLVTQVLEPTIGNYFRNAAQNSDVIDFLKNRQQRQGEARKSISDALQEYNVGAVDTLIGDITPPDELMKTLTDRKIADQRKVTFDSQRLAEDNRRELEKSKAMADTQASVVTAERSVSIAGYAADATIKQAEGQARAKTLNAEADATVTKVTGDADAGKTLAVGTAEADVIKLKIASMTSDNYAVIETAKALAASGFKLVPDIVAGGEGGGSNSLMNIFLARLVKDSNGAVAPKP